MPRRRRLPSPAAAPLRCRLVRHATTLLLAAALGALVAFEFFALASAYYGGSSFFGLGRRFEQSVAAAHASAELARLPPRGPLAPLNATNLFADVGSRDERKATRRAAKRRKGVRGKPQWAGVASPPGAALTLCGAATRSEITILLTVTAIYEDFFANWLEHFRRLRLNNSVVVVAEDGASFAALARSLSAMRAASGDGGGDNRSSSSGFDAPNVQLVRGRGGAGGFFASRGFNEVMAMRAAYIGRLLASGRRVVLADVDSVWLSDPLPYFDAQPPVGTPAIAPLVAQLDGPDHYCAGLLHLCPVLEVIELVERWEGSLLVGRARSDQTVLNHLIADSSVVPRGLPRALFPSGKLFFNENAQGQRVRNEWYSAAARENAVVVHNNYIAGHDEKLARFVKHGMWLPRYRLHVDGNTIVEKVALAEGGGSSLAACPRWLCNAAGSRGARRSLFVHEYSCSIHKVK